MERKRFLAVVMTVMMVISMIPSMAVSYTHLDVYKRQLLFLL